MATQLLTHGDVLLTLLDHNIEVWNGYAVEQYTLNGVPGECFTDLRTLAFKSTLYTWLGY